MFKKLFFILALSAGLDLGPSIAQQATTAPTRPVGDSSNAIATTAFVGTAVSTSATTALPATSNLYKGTGSAGVAAAATPGTDYILPSALPATSSLYKGTGSAGVATAATANTDYTNPAGLASAINTALPSTSNLYGGTGSAGAAQAISIGTGLNLSANTLTATAAALTGFRNRIFNGGVNIDQRNSGSSQTITAGAALAYTVDRWYAYSTGANVTGQRVTNAGTSGSPSQYVYQFTGAASVTAVNFCQRIEAVNSFDIANNTAALGVNLADSLLTTVTWSLAYANTTDTFGTIASPSVTSISSGTFTVSSTLTRYTTTISIPSAATTGLQLCLSVGAQTSGTFQIGDVQLESATAATTFERRPLQTELALCQRYYEIGAAYTYSVSINGNGVSIGYPYKVTKRVTPTVVVTNTSATGVSATYNSQVNGVDSFWGYHIASGSGTFGVAIQDSFTSSAEL